MSKRTVLIVDDEAPIRDMIRLALELADFVCLEAEDALVAHSIIIDQRPDLVLLDWMLPNMAGVDFLRRLRREELTKELPVIMLTAKASEDNKIQGLDSGADDYITKPFAPRELISRINALMRRSVVIDETQKIDVMGLILDPVSHRVLIDNESVEMGPTEFRLLHFFMTHQERAYSRDQLLDHVWGGNVYVEERTIDVHIRRLRKALDYNGKDYGALIQTVRGTGYRFSANGVSLHAN